MSYIEVEVPWNESRVVSLAEVSKNVLSVEDGDGSSKPQSYGVAAILSDGCFLSRNDIACMMRRLEKKNSLIF